MELKPVALALVFVLVGAAILGGAWWLNQEEQEQLENAVEVAGTVEETGVDREERIDRRDPDNDGNYESREREVEFDPTVRYSYTYEGTEYESDSIYPISEPSFDTRTAAENFTSQFPAGERTTVFVNSEDPSESFLVRKQSGDTLLLFAGLFAGVFWLVAAGYAYRGFSGK